MQIEGLEHVEIMRYAYGIEYDYAPPEQLQATLETKNVDGLFLAGQINGTTGVRRSGGTRLDGGNQCRLESAGTRTAHPSPE